ncbi:AraC family transcriptional regulator [Actinoplanes sp. DH11]|uniref:AraC family transcriptional regulator n=1 Tax=Actinoplanes sp. DH11 TaxID=2857011 RepID=UPI001E48A629|nr:AraC family transcriptional regulator [Actinoplanes sp. DH11]
MPVETHASGDVEQSRAFLSRYYYSNFVDVLNWKHRWRSRFDVSPAAAVTVGDLQFGTDVRIRFGELGAYHVNLPVTGSLTWRQGRGAPRQATARTAAVFRPVGETSLERWGGDCRLLAVKIERAALEDQLTRLIDTPVRAPIELAPTIDLTRAPGTSWLRLVRLMAADAAQPQGLLHNPVVGAQLQEALIAGLLSAADHPYRERLERPSPVTAAPGAIRRVVDAMRAQPGRPFTAADLALVAGVSVRSLQESFRRYIGMSPMAYLRQVRLARVHEDLRQADPVLHTVTGIAYRYGFLHMGRFAAEYRAQYGVPPSDTLRR